MLASDEALYTMAVDAVTVNFINDSCPELLKEIQADKEARI
jgi:hypothetical protein